MGGGGFRRDGGSIVELWVGDRGNRWLATSEDSRDGSDGKFAETGGGRPWGSPSQSHNGRPFISDESPFGKAGATDDSSNANLLHLQVLVAATQPL